MRWYLKQGKVIFYTLKDKTSFSSPAEFQNNNNQFYKHWQEMEGWTASGKNVCVKEKGSWPFDCPRVKTTNQQALLIHIA